MDQLSDLALVVIDLRIQRTGAAGKGAQHLEDRRFLDIGARTGTHAGKPAYQLRAVTSADPLAQSDRISVTYSRWSKPPEGN